MNEPHRLTNVDVEQRTAVCSICGPTRIRVRGSGRGHTCQTVREREWRARGRDWRRKNYGLSQADYESLLESQAGRCAICKEAPARLYVDHDHDHGAVRALLCQGCNTVIGMAKEDPKVLGRPRIMWNHTATGTRADPPSER